MDDDTKRCPCGAVADCNDERCSECGRPFFRREDWPGGPQPEDEE